MSKFSAIKNKYGFYSASPMPTEKELEEFYKNVYFQEDSQNYEQQYTEEEYKYFLNESKVTEYIYNNITQQNKNNNSLLDIGCGEGYFAKYFYNNNWKVNLVDYSSYGIITHNNELVNNFKEGCIYKNLDSERIEKKEYNLISIKNVLEHVVDPELLLAKVKKLMTKNSLLRIEVPNDYSSFQELLLENNNTTNTWFKPPEHLHYFTFESLSGFLDKLGFNVEMVMSDFPIELYLLNDFSNYTKNTNTGKQAHYGRVKANNFIFDKGIKNYVEFFESCAKVDFGRQVIIYCSLK
jgi:2-polyprenyl-3-methyl-5-hydroxy-6-metoxy-1,4-benzoquinol methylase